MNLIGKHWRSKDISPLLLPSWHITGDSRINWVHLRPIYLATKIMWQSKGSPILLSQKFKGWPLAEWAIMHPSPKNKALVSPYYGIMVVNNTSKWPCFLGWHYGIGRVLRLRFAWKYIPSKRRRVSAPNTHSYKEDWAPAFVYSLSSIVVVVDVVLVAAVVFLLLLSLLCLLLLLLLLLKPFMQVNTGRYLIYTWILWVRVYHQGNPNYPPKKLPSPGIRG